MKVIIGNEYQTGIYINTEKVVCEEWVKKRADESTQPNGLYNISIGLCNGLRVVGDVDGFNEEKLEELLKKGAEFVMVDIFRCRPDTVEMLFRKMKERPGKIWLTPFGERDGCFYEWAGSTPNYFGSRQEAADYFKSFLCHHALIWADPNNSNKVKHVGDCASSLLPLRNIARHIEAGTMPEWAHMAAHSSAMYVLHHYFEWGFKMVWLEQSAWFGNMQLSLSFLRGAARQFNGKIGIDFSAWGGMNGGGEFNHLPVCYGSDGRRLYGANPDHLFKGFILSYLSGVNFIFMEVTEHAYFLPVKKGSKTPVLSEFGRNAKAFADFALKRHPDCGTPCVPVAVMLEHYHGWDAPRFSTEHFVWGNKVPYENADHMIENFFENAYPGYKLAPRSYEPDTNKEVPWKTGDEYKKMLQSGMDMRPYDKGKLTQNRWGDGIDVVNENCDVEVLKKYPVLVILGRLKIKPALEAKLKEYVEAGGNLILSSSSLGTAYDLAGVQELGGGANQGRIFWGKDCFFEGSYLFTNYKPVKAEVLAKNHRGEPLYFKNKIGKGNVYLIAPLYGEIEARQMLKSTQHLLDMVINPHLPVTVEGAPIHLNVNKHDDHIWITLFNHSSEEWKGTVIIHPSAKVTMKNAMEIWTDVPVEKSCRKQDGKILLSAKVKPFEFAIYEFKK